MSKIVKIIVNGVDLVINEKNVEIDAKKINDSIPIINPLINSTNSFESNWYPYPNIKLAPIAKMMNENIIAPTHNTIEVIKCDK